MSAIIFASSKFLDLPENVKVMLPTTLFCVIMTLIAFSPSIHSLTIKIWDACSFPPIWPNNTVGNGNDIFYLPESQSSLVLAVGALCWLGSLGSRW